MERKIFIRKDCLKSKRADDKKAEQAVRVCRASIGSRTQLTMLVSCVYPIKKTMHMREAVSRVAAETAMPIQTRSVKEGEWSK
jgi:hypothetical protein